MAIKPMTYSGPMVSGLWHNRKTQTRRAPDLSSATAPIMEFVKVATEKVTGRAIYEMRDKRGESVALKKGRWLLDYHFRPPIAVNDIIYVREPWHVSNAFDDYSPAKSHKGKNVLPRGVEVIRPATLERLPHYAGKFRQAMHMPRWMSRITLKVTDVRIERLKDISEADALAEGIEMETADPPFYYVPGIWPHVITAVGVEEMGPHAARSYFKLWDYINGGGASELNPWVIAYSFHVMRGNVDDLIADGTIQIGDKP